MKKNKRQQILVKMKKKKNREAKKSRKNVEIKNIIKRYVENSRGKSGKARRERGK